MFMKCYKEIVLMKENYFFRINLFDVISLIVRFMIFLRKSDFDFLPKVDRAVV